MQIESELLHEITDFFNTNNPQYLSVTSLLLLLFYNNVKSRFLGAEGHPNIMLGIQSISLRGLYMEEAREATLK